MTDPGRSAGVSLAVATATVVVLISIGGSQAQTGRAMAINDLLAAIRVTEPALSRDGRLVAYVRATTDLETGRRNRDVYIMPSDGSAAPKPLAGGPSDESTPQFSANGQQVAFISSRDGAPQVYTVPAG